LRSTEFKPLTLPSRWIKSKNKRPFPKRLESFDHFSKIFAQTGLFFTLFRYNHYIAFP